LNLGVSRNRFCDFLADPDSRNFSRFYTNIAWSRYFDNLDATWEQMYVNDPTQGVESAASQARVLGGQGEMW
jgi:hypothetical protein